MGAFTAALLDATSVRDGEDFTRNRLPYLPSYLRFSASYERDTNAGNRSIARTRGYADDREALWSFIAVLRCRHATSKSAILWIQIADRAAASYRSKLTQHCNVL